MCCGKFLWERYIGIFPVTSVIFFYLEWVVFNCGLSQTNATHFIFGEDGWGG